MVGSDQHLRRLVDDGEFLKTRNYDASWRVAEAVSANPLRRAHGRTRDIVLKPGMGALDLGCGRARSSVFLAGEFGVQAWAVDLPTPASDNRAP